MADLSSLGDLVVTVGGNIAPLQASLDQIPTAAQAAASSMNSALADVSGFAELEAASQASAGALRNLGAAASTDVSESLKNLGDAASGYSLATRDLIARQEELNQRLATAQGVLSEIQQAYEQGAVSAQTLARAQKEVEQATNAANVEVGQSAGAMNDLLGSFTKGITFGAAFTVAFEAVKGAVDLVLDGFKLLGEGITKAAEAGMEMFASIQNATIGMQALTGSTERTTATIQTMRQLALDQGLSFPQLLEASQKVTALGFSFEQTKNAMQAAANASAAVGTDLSFVSASIDRMAQSGTLAGRQLAAIGLNLHDVAKAANTTVEDLQGPGNIFKAMDPSDRLDLLIAALNKYQGVSLAMSQTLSREWQKTKTDLVLAFEEGAAAVVPALQQIVTAVQSNVTPAIFGLVEEFKKLGSQIGPSIQAGTTEAIKWLGDLITVVGNASAGASTVIGSFQAAAAQGGVVGGVIHSLGQDAGIAGRIVADQLTLGVASLGESVARLIPDLATFSNMLKDVPNATVNAVESTTRFRDATDKLKASIDAAAAAELASTHPLKDITDQHDLLVKSLSASLQQYARVKEAVDAGVASQGQLDDALKAVNKSLAALDGTTKTAKTAVDSFTEAWNRLDATALKKSIDDTVTSLHNLADPIRLANALQQQWRQEMADDLVATTSLVSKIEVLDGAQRNQAAAAQAAALGIQYYTTQTYNAAQATGTLTDGIQIINGQAGQVTTSMETAADAVKKFGDVAEETKKSVDDLNASMAQASSDALQVADAAGTFTFSGEGSSSLTFHLKPGDVITAYGQSVTVGLDEKVKQDMAFIQSILDKRKQDAQAAAQAQASTGTSTTANPFDALLQSVRDASAALSEVNAQYQLGLATITDVNTANQKLLEAYAKLNGTIPQTTSVVQDLTGQISSTNGIILDTGDAMSTLAGVTTVLAGATQSAADSATVAARGFIDATVAVTAAAVTAVATVNGVSTTPISLGSQASTPLLSAGPSGAHQGGITPFAGITINVQAGTVVGANGMQDLSNMVAQAVTDRLQAMGPKVTRL